MRSLILTVLIVAMTSLIVAMTSPDRAIASDAAAPGPSLGIDWQGPAQLPLRFRNHCSVDAFSGRPYCSDHCGADYQFYYCSAASFGCCRLGRGYCDPAGTLRCHP